MESESQKVFEKQSNLHLFGGLEINGDVKNSQN